MLFDRFVFVLHLLFCYNWFLLGTQLSVTIGYIPIISLLATLSSISIVTGYQLQTILKRGALKQHEKWETIIWCCVHISLTMLIIADWLQLANIVVIGLMAGVLLTGIIIVVGTCACYVIMLDGQDWIPHIHLTCISFWVMAQYMQIRLPSEDLNYITTMPVVLMAILRMVEMIEESDTAGTIIREGIVWIACIVMHIICDQGHMSKLTFFWGTAVTVLLLIVSNKLFTRALFMMALPFVLIAFCLYIFYKRIKGLAPYTAVRTVTVMYDDWTAEPNPIPLDEEYGANDFEGKL